LSNVTLPELLVFDTERKVSPLLAFHLAARSNLNAHRRGSSGAIQRVDRHASRCPTFVDYADRRPRPGTASSSDVSRSIPATTQMPNLRLRPVPAIGHRRERGFR
jgi:hypothetical protein